MPTCACCIAWAASPSGTLPPSRWTETINCHANLRILLPQNRCLPEPLAAPFPRQPEPRCNTLDFAGRVVVPKGCCLSPVGSVRCFKMCCILRSPLATRTPLETQEKRLSTALLVLGQCADPLDYGVLQKLLLIYSIPRACYTKISTLFTHRFCETVVF